MTTTKKRVGIVLFQLGGPDSLATVEPFLRNLFLDPDIIPLGPLNFIRGPLARYIAKKRTPPVAGRYAMIGRRFCHRHPHRTSTRSPCPLPRALHRSRCRYRHALLETAHRRRRRHPKIRRPSR